MSNDLFTGTMISAGFTAAAAIMVASPAGALGGAIFGGVSYLLGRPITHIVDKVFNTDKKNATVISRIVSTVTGFFAGSAAAWGISVALGVNLTFTGALVLSVAPFAILAIIGILATGALMATNNGYSRA